MALEDQELVESIYRESLEQQWNDYTSERFQLGLIAEEIVFDSHSGLENGHDKAGSPLTMGYVTRDSCPGKGDDIEHIPGEYSS